MRQLKFAQTLPALQFFVAVALLGWGHRVAPPPGSDTLYMPTVTLICFGINAPAVLFKSVWYVFPRTSLSLIGFTVQELSFLTGVILVWYLIGRALDHRESWGAPVRLTSRRILASFLLIGLGILLFFLGLVPIRSHPGGNSLGGILAGVLFIVWSLAIIAGCLSRLARDYAKGARMESDTVAPRQIRHR